MVALDHQRLAVLTQPRQELATHAKGRRAVRGSLLDAGQRQRNLAYGLERYRSLLVHDAPPYYDAPQSSARASRRRCVIAAGSSPPSAICLTCASTSAQRLACGR